MLLGIHLGDSLELQRKGSVYYVTGHVRAVCRRCHTTSNIITQELHP